MNVLKKGCLRKNNHLKIKRKQGTLEIENNSDRKEYLVFNKIFVTNRKPSYINSKVQMISGDLCQFKLLAKNMHVLHTIFPNTETYLEEMPKIAFLGITLQPHSKVLIKSLDMVIGKTKEKTIDNHFKGNILLLCPGYPSEENKYQCAFIHTRVQGYLNLNWKVDVAVVNELFINKTEKYSFEGVPVIRTGFNEIRTLLQNKRYDKILVHFFDEKYAQILDASDITKTKVFLYSHGIDTLYRVWNKLNAQYFMPLKEIPNDLQKTFPEKDALIKRYNDMDNVKFAFVSNWARNLSESLIGIKYRNSEIIPCNINTEVFTYQKKDPSLRKKVFVLRKFDNLSTYSIDINVRVILELSKRECFKDMEFSIYGDGDYHEELVAPLRQFPNVHIYKKFLTHKEIKKVHDQHGIALFASRFDTQGVSAIEAAMSGNVVVTSKNIGTEEYIDPRIGTYCETENFVEYADLIEKLYYDENLFIKMSDQMHESVKNTCSYENTLEKDIKMIEEDSSVKYPEFTYKKPSPEPLLTIAIPSYNCGKFLISGIHTLIDHPLHDKLEILIINDGSKDDTAKVGKDLENLTKVDKDSVVKLIDKKNGGHGSTINKGIELAKGKYFKLMDGDDYFITSELVKLLEILEHENSDIILTNYIEDFAIDGRKHPVHNYTSMVPGVQYKLEDMSYPKYGFDHWGPLLSTSTYKTEILKKANFKIDEHCFYVDMEYNFIGYVYSDTVTYYPLDIYNYYLGRAGQSVSQESYTRNYKHHETVTLRVINEYYNNPNISEIKKEYLKKRIILPLINTQYIITVDFMKNKKGFRDFERELKKYPEFYLDPQITTKRIKFHRMTKGVFINVAKKVNSVKGFIRRLFRRG